MQKERLARVAVLATLVAAAAPGYTAPPPPPGPPKAQPSEATAMGQVPIYAGTEGRRPRPGPDLPESDLPLPKMPTVPN